MKGITKPLGLGILILLILISFQFSSCQDQKQSQKILGTQHEKVFKSQPTKNGPAENVRLGIKDRNGNLWFGTTGHGVFKYDGDSFTLFTAKDGLGDNRVIALCEDKDGNILFGTGKGLYLFDGKSIRPSKLYDSLGPEPIGHLFLDSKGQLWIGTINSGLYFYNGESLKAINLDENVSNEFCLSLNGISDILEDHNGTIWLTSWAIADEGIIKFTGDSLIQLSKIHRLPDSLFYSAFMFPKGKYWFGSRKNGLFTFENGEFQAFLSESGPLASSGCVLDMLIDKNGFVWFTTGINGVYRYDPSRVGEDAFKNYTTADGLINNSVFWVVEDDKGDLWFGTRDVGLSRFDGESFVDFSE